MPAIRSENQGDSDPTASLFFKRETGVALPVRAGTVGGSVRATSRDSRPRLGASPAFPPGTGSQSSGGDAIPKILPALSTSIAIPYAVSVALFSLRIHFT